MDPSGQPAGGRLMAFGRGEIADRTSPRALQSPIMSQARRRPNLAVASAPRPTPRRKALRATTDLYKSQDRETERGHERLVT